jgi:4-hydroxy-tetrahydrodipicolinate synthase
MTALDRHSLKGFVPAIVTPFTPSGEIMMDAFSDLVGWLIDIGADGICVAGDNGESWTLDAEERGKLTRIAVERAAGRVPVLTGCSAPSSTQTVRYALAAAEAGAAGLLLLPQTYVLRTTREELLHRAGAAADSVGRAGPRAGTGSVALQTDRAVSDADGHWHLAVGIQGGAHIAGAAGRCAA